MTERKWTSGPWGAEVDEDYMEADVYDSDGASFATLYPSLTVKADASLISAAPELYEALAEMVAMREEAEFCDEDTLKKYYNVLAKANGETL